MCEPLRFDLGEDEQAWTDKARDWTMPASMTDVVDELIRLGVIFDPAKQKRALSLVANLSPGFGQSVYEQVATILVGEDLVTDYQADLIGRNRIDSLIKGRYLVLSKVGQGAMGEVFKARHRVMGRTVALKTILQNKADQGTIDRFLREIQTLGKLEHPNVINISDAEWDLKNQSYYLAMEYVEGTDLHTWVNDRIGQGVPLILKDACSQLYHAAKGLGHAHSEKVAHRDIKPSNLMITAKGLVKVADFGMARFHDASTITTGFVGTPAFAAPEVCQQFDDNQKPELDFRSDIYSLGCTFYFLCTGQFLYRANPIAFIHHHINTPAPKLKATCPQAPDWVEDLFQRMVAKRPEDRFQSMDEIMEFMKVNSRPKARSSIKNSLNLEMIWCLPGRFQMGSPAGAQYALSNEKAVQVELTQGFWMGKSPITQKMYQDIMKTNPSWFCSQGSGKDVVKGMDTSDFPVESVSWNDCVEFCEKLTKREHEAKRLPSDLVYRLPTEAEWEYACRAGTESAYWFGDSPAELVGYGWCADNSGKAVWDSTKVWDEFGWSEYSKQLEKHGCRPHKVGEKFEANPWGLHDMHGNVWEWCWDGYAAELSSGVDPVSPPGGAVTRVLRGGSWNCYPRNCRSALRNGRKPDYRFYYYGFRVVAALPVPPR